MIKKKLKCNKGATSVVNVTVIILVAIMFLALFWEYFSMYNRMSLITDHMEQTIIKTATSNYYNVYKGIREGNSSAHDYAGNDIWVAVVTTEDVIAGLEKTLTLDKNNNTLSKYTSDGTLLYSISNIQSQVSNVEVGTTSADAVKLTFYTTADAIIPLHFMGVTINVNKKVSINSHFIPRY